MKKLLLAVFTSVVVTLPAQAAFLSHSYVSGMNRICVYDDLASTVAITVESYEMCPSII